MTQQTLFRPAPPPPPSPEELERARILALEESRKLAEQLATRVEHRLKEPARHVATPGSSSADLNSAIVEQTARALKLGVEDRRSIL